MVMTACLDDGRVRAFVSAKLTADARREVEDHVDDCDDCRQLLVALVRETPREREPWQAGDRVGRYVVGAAVGRGAMGEVFRAEDRELHRPVALKRLHASTSADARARLVREARAAAQLQHPNVVAVYEIVDDGAGAVLATEWIDGVTLREWLAGERRSWRDVVRVVAGAGRGLAAAHAAGIVHRDFKPENVLVDRAGRARVADFGLASGFETAEAAKLEGGPNARVTVTGTLAGTPAYMAPELLDGARPDARSDQFAFAVTLFEAVHRKYPFAGGTAEAIWAAMSTAQIERGDRTVPAWLDRTIRRALAPDPADRFSDLDALLDLVERRSRRGIAVPLALAGAVGGVAVAAVLVAAQRDAQVPCGEELVDSVWSQPVRDGYAKQFTAVAPTRSGAALAFTDRVLEQWTEAWKLGRKSACTAEPAERRARTSCLDRQLGELRAQLAVWVRADAAVVDRSAVAAAALPAPAECTSAVASAPASAALVEATAQLDALRRAGKFLDAREQLPAVLEAAAREADPLAKGRAYMAVAFIEYELRDHAAARDHLAIAAQAARQLGDDRLLAETLVLDGAVRNVANKPAEALGILDAVELMSPTGATASKLHAVRGEALAMLDRRDEAVASFQRGIAILEQEVARDPSRRLALAAMIGAAGSTMGRGGKPEAGIAELRRALQIEESLLGPNHPELGRTLHDLASLQHRVGEIDESIANYERARAIFVGAMGEASLEVASCDGAMADLMLHVKGDFDAAYALATRARDLYLAAKAGPALLSSIETALGNIQQNRDRCRDAIPHYERALAAAKEAQQIGSDLAISYSNLASCLADVGNRDPEARNALEAALAAWDADPKAGPERSHAMAVLADLEARAGRFARAIEIGEQALAVIKDLDGEPWTSIRNHVHDSLKLWRRGRTG